LILSLVVHSLFINPLNMKTTHLSSGVGPSANWDFLSSFSHSAGRRILHRLQQGPQCNLGDLMEQVGLERGALLTLLNLMQAAGLIEARQRRGQVVYALYAKAPDQLWHWERG
jgi:DNA-binding transcriptional ArsR family regulator